MGSIDATTWRAIGLLLTVLGVVLSLLVWRRRGAVSGLRGIAWSLLPAAAGLTGTLKLVWQIGEDIAHWAVRLVFSPVVWAGILLAGISLALFAVTAAMRARGAGSKTGSKTTPTAGDSSGPSAGTSAGASQERGRLPRRRSSTAAEPAVQDKDMDDIEAILRKHGIT